MKKIFLIGKLLTSPILMSHSLTATQNTMYISVPSDFEVIYKRWDSKYLFRGLKDQKTIPSIEGYNTITIPKNVNIIDCISKTSGDDRLDAIIRIQAEEGTNLEEIFSCSISGLSNLEEIIFPSSIHKIGKHAIVNCPKLKLLDFSAFKEDYSFISPNLFNLNCPDKISKSGTIYVNNQQVKTLVEYKFHSLDLFSNWNIIIK